MIDVETRTEILQLVREAVERAAADNESSRLAVLLDEIQQQLSASEYSYGMDGGEGSAPGNFEPIFGSDQKLASIGEGYCPVGRKFYDVNLDPNESYKIEEGVIYIEVNHPTSSSVSPTLYLKGAASAGGLFLNADTNKTNIPLYKIKGGAIVVDYRSAMSMTLREL